MGEVARRARMAQLGHRLFFAMLLAGQLESQDAGGVQLHLPHGAFEPPAGEGAEGQAAGGVVAIHLT